MTASARRQRDQAERRDRIVAAARAMAEADGWEKVTTRRLADAIEYSQPVLYGHFPNGKPEIMTAVALAGFTEIATALSDYSARAGDRTRLRTVAAAYLEFAAENPATYEVMFARPIDALFADESSPPELTTAFDAVAAAVPGSGETADRATAAELLWSALHGLATLESSGRLRESQRERRLALLIDLFLRG